MHNAGILRYRMLVNMSDDEWNAVNRVQLRKPLLRQGGPLGMRESRRKAGLPSQTCIIDTCPSSGMFGIADQINYSVATTRIAAITSRSVSGTGPLRRDGPHDYTVAMTRMTRA